MGSEKFVQVHQECEQEQHVAVDLAASLFVPLMSWENFQDAQFFLKSARTAEHGSVMRRRYLRASAVFFCACVDAWKNEEIVMALRKKEQSLDEAEKKLLAILLGKRQEDIPDRGKLWKKLARYYPSDEGKVGSLKKQWDKVEAYRDSFVHYAERDFRKQYDEEAILSLLSNAPALIGEIMECFHGAESEWYSRDTLSEEA